MCYHITFYNQDGLYNILHKITVDFNVSENIDEKTEELQVLDLTV